ncbi:MAG: hypothetical protein ACLU37_00705 [Collinsella sp.]
MLSRGQPTQDPGIGAGFVPVLDTQVYDEIIPVRNDDAFATGRAVGHKEACSWAFRRCRRVNRTSWPSAPRTRARPS